MHVRLGINAPQVRVHGALRDEKLSRNALARTASQCKRQNLRFAFGKPRFFCDDGARFLEIVSGARYFALKSRSVNRKR